MNKKAGTSLKNIKPALPDLHHSHNDLFASKLKLKLKRHYTKIADTHTIVFITGAFVSHNSWNEWIAYFKSKGYTTLAPAWPFKDEPAEVLRKRHQQDSELAGLTLSGLIEHYGAIIKALPEKPILIGHSLGGLITQIMVNRDLVAAGIAIHSVPPLGVFPYQPSSLKAAWKSLGLFSSLNKTYLMSFKDWQYAFVNGMARDEQESTYEKNTIPESKKVARGILSGAARIDFEKMHVPLLLTAGDNDHITPANLNLRNYKRYKRNGSVVDYKKFPGRNHFVLGLPSWKEDADFILKWISSLR
ncbi:Pimeloyl-ACP methyl ester carboxylesterase [Pedobacter westerhofensis]|uniref:Pimeloyl-ACP methyl ester carboxylesterase n=1 Tax=Pedobacter westerhofensis TaxID=425512 RepID=A0A521CP96_9SPHI|nr:alpha/beta hydrolase [Pedobacter westerhofensis]SMO61277.1 Pimeloyl-ACP methyl ester carboxylesterase [Pedobacter westerhofensis]